MKNNKKKRGFTIIELVIVIAVIAILAGVLIPTFSSIIEKANRSARYQAVAQALPIALADQEDAAFDAAIFEVTTGTDSSAKKYYYTYQNGTLSQTEAETAPLITDIPTSGTTYTIKFAEAAADKTAYVCTIVEANLSNVTIYISADDFAQAGK